MTTRVALAFQTEAWHAVALGCVCAVQVRLSRSHASGGLAAPSPSSSEDPDVLETAAAAAPGRALARPPPRCDACEACANTVDKSLRRRCLLVRASAAAGAVSLPCVCLGQRGESGRMWEQGAGASWSAKGTACWDLMPSSCTCEAAQAQWVCVPTHVCTYMSASQLRELRTPRVCLD